MASTYENDLRLEEMATGENSGSWGTKTNTNLELIADAFSYGTETIANADTTITIADGAADAARSLALKINSSADLTTTRTITLAPNTTSKVWIIENNTSGGQTLTISAGSGTNITLLNGQTKIIATDGIGAGSNVVELTQDLAIADLFIDDDLSLQSDGGILKIGADADLQVTHSGSAGTITNSTGDLTVDVAGDIILDADGKQIIFADGGTQFGQISTNSTPADMAIKSLISDEDIIFQGIDNGSSITALTLDMSEAGRATFNDVVRIPTNLEHDGDADTFFGFPGANNFVITAGNVSRVYGSASETVINEDSADLDFRVESDSNANMLFVDAGNNRVGIGAAPSNPFEVNAGSGNAFIYTTGVTALVAQADGAGDTLILQTTDTSATNGPNIKFRRVATGADNDGLMQLGVNGFNDTGTEETQFFRQRHFIIDASNGTEDGAFDMFNMIGGTLRSVINHDSTATIFNDNSVDIDFRVESDANANFLLLDASAEMLLVGGGANTAGGAAFKVTQSNDGELTLDSTSSESNIVSYDRNGSAYHPLNIYGSNVNINPTAGNAAIFNEASLDADFRVESDNVSNMLQVDAGNNRLNIGGSPQTYSSNRVNIYGDNVNPPGAANGNLAVYAVDSQASGNGGSISLGGRYTDAGAFYQFGAIQAVKKNSTSGNAAGLVKLYYVNSSNGTNPFLEASEDEIVFNNAGLDDDFRVESDSNSNALFVNAGANAVLVNTNTQSSTGFGGNVPLQVGNGWQYFSQMYTSGGTRTITFTGSITYMVEITYTTLANYGGEQIAQSRWIAGRRDNTGFAHLVNSADIIGTAADITYTTSDSGSTRTYTLTLDNGSTGANVFHMVEFKAWGNVGAITF